MAVNKTAGVRKVKSGSSAKRAAAQMKAAPKRATATRKAAPKKAAVLGKAAPKKAMAFQKSKPAPKKPTASKSVGPKLTGPQHELLKRIVANKDAKGYHTANKPEHRVIETLLKHKVVKKGPKNPETKYFHYQVSTIGKKYLDSGSGSQELSHSRFRSSTSRKLQSGRPGFVVRATASPSASFDCASCSSWSFVRRVKVGEGQAAFLKGLHFWLIEGVK